MISKHHKIRQIVYSIVFIFIVGNFLYLGLKPSLFGEAFYNEKYLKEYEEDMVEDELPILPEFLDRERISEIGEYEEGRSVPKGSHRYRSYFVSSVIDGNTIIVDGEKRVRLAGIKSPDKDEDMGVEAFQFLQSMIEGREIYFYFDALNPEDNFGRIRGIIYLEDTNVNIEMIRAGLAHVFPVHPSVIDPDDWRVFEKEAKNARRGLWGGESYHNGFVEKEDDIPVL